MLRHVRPARTRLLNELNCEILVSLTSAEASAVYRSLRPEIGRGTVSGMRTEISLASRGIRIRCVAADPSKLRAMLNSLLRLIGVASRVLAVTRQGEKALSRAQHGAATE